MLANSSLRIFSFKPTNSKALITLGLISLFLSPILVKGKADGKFQNDDGSFNEQRYQMAAALLSYIGTSSVGSNDGLQFVEDYLNADECRKAFELIFETMEQKQHYDMMIKNN